MEAHLAHPSSQYGCAYPRGSRLLRSLLILGALILQSSNACAESTLAAAIWNQYRTPPVIPFAAFPHEETPVDVAHIVRNNIYVYGIRGEGKSATHRAEAFMAQKRFDATRIHTHTFPLEDLPTAIRYAKDRVEDAIKVVVKARGASAHRIAAE